MLKDKSFGYVVRRYLNDLEKDESWDKIKEVRHKYFRGRKCNGKFTYILRKRKDDK
jgi:hypothetical protein